MSEDVHQTEWFKRVIFFLLISVSLPSSRDVSTAISNLLQKTIARWQHCSNSMQMYPSGVCPPRSRALGGPSGGHCRYVKSRYWPSSRFMLSLVFHIHIASLIPLDA